MKWMNVRVNLIVCWAPWQSACSDSLPSSVRPLKLHFTFCTCFSWWYFKSVCLENQSASACLEYSSSTDARFYRWVIVYLSVIEPTTDMKWFEPNYRWVPHDTMHHARWIAARIYQNPIVYAMMSQNWMNHNWKAEKLLKKQCENKCEWCCQFANKFDGSTIGIELIQFA